MRRFLTLFPIALAAGGLLLILAAFFARQLGLDNNEHWGIGRYLMVAAGGCLWLWLGWMLTSVQRKWLDQKLQAVSCRWQALPAVMRARELGQKITQTWRESTLARLMKGVWLSFISLPGVRFIAAESDRQAVFWAVLGLSITLVLYFWLATAGNMTHLVPASGFIDLQGRAFLNGQLNLLETPPANLLALKNPYDLSQRTNLKYIWDASLFEGKYYLYWGPLPAAVDAVYRGVTGQGLGDEVFGLSLLCLLAIIQTIWLVDLRKTFFPKSAPLWLMFFVLAASMISPLTFNISFLSVYVVSTLSAQVFILGGVLLVRCAFSGMPVRVWRWVILGLLLGFATSARIHMLLVIAWIGFLMLTQAWVDGRGKWGKWVKPMLLTGTAVGVVLAGMMVYNYARFYSPFEFGTRYQLSVIDNNHAFNSYLSVLNIPPNLYAYLIRPVMFRTEFPFIYSQWLTADTFPAFIVRPPGYMSTDPMDGLLLTTPFILLAIIPLWAQVGEVKKSVTSNTFKKWFMGHYSEK